MTRLPNIAYCTIASANYLAQVQVLAESLSVHRPNAKLYVLLCESPESGQRIGLETGLNVVTPEEVCTDWLEMAFYYDIVEYNTALKPFLIEQLLNRGHDGVLYFDPDIAFYNSTEFLEELLTQEDILLTPHAHRPVPNDGRQPEMANYIRAGQFNLGFIGFSSRQEAKEALLWWQDVCREQCLFDSNLRYFVDQFWAAAFPSFASHCRIIRHTGCNVAYWNVFQRPIEMHGGHWKAGQDDLVFFHFSGLDLNNLPKLSRHQNRVTVADGSDLYLLLADYRDRLNNASWKNFKGETYSFANYHNGPPISISERRNFLRLPSQERKLIGNPFAQQDAIRRIVALNITPPRAVLLAKGRLIGLRKLVWRLTGEFRWRLREHGTIRTCVVAARFIFRRITRPG